MNSSRESLVGPAARTAAVWVALLVAGCNGTDTSTSTAAVSLDPQQIVQARVETFEWSPDGRVTYSIEGESGTEWFIYDPSTRVVAAASSPDPSAPVLQMLSGGSGAPIGEAISSPSGDKILYERLPDGYEEPSADDRPPDYFPPMDLWLANADGSGQVRIEEGFASKCGMLTREAAWSIDESLVVGECSPHLGLPAFYVADLAAQDAYTLFFMDQFGAGQILPGQAAVSNDGEWLAFIDIPRNSLWKVPVAELSQINGGVLDPALRLPVEGTLYSPQWSSDDQWIYYWHSPPIGPDTDACDVSLQRVNIDTGEIEEVLSKQDLISLMGVSEYSALTICGVEPEWKLSPDGSWALVSIPDTINSEPALVLLPLD